MKTSGQGIKTKAREIASGVQTALTPKHATLSADIRHDWTPKHAGFVFKFGEVFVWQKRWVAKMSVFGLLKMLKH